MKFTRVAINPMAYALPEDVYSSLDIEQKLSRYIQD